jgi:hypothetical protein
MNIRVSMLLSLAALGCSVVQDFGPPRSDAPVLAPPAVDDGGAPPSTLAWMNPRPSGNDLRAVWSSAPGETWFAGAAGTILRWDGRELTAPPRTEDGQVTNETFYAIGGTSRNDVWFAGQAGPRSRDARVVRFDGTTWRTSELKDHTVHALWAVSPDEVWLSVDNGRLLRMNAHFFNINDPAPAVADSALYAMWGSNGRDVWAVGDRGAIFHLGDDARWTRAGTSAAGVGEPFADTNKYVGIWGSSARDVWAVFVSGANGIGGYVGFSHWDGAAWTVKQIYPGDGVSSAPSHSGHLVWGTSPTETSAAIGPGFRWDGTEWRIDRAGPAMRALGSGPSGELVTAGAFGRIARREEGKWSDVVPGMRAPISEISVARDGSVWALAGASLWRWENNGWTKGATVIEGPAVHGISSWGDPDAQRAWPMSELSLGREKIVALSSDDVWVAGRERSDFSSSDPTVPVRRYGRAGLKQRWALDLEAVDSFWVGAEDQAWVVGSRGAVRWNGRDWLRAEAPPRTGLLQVTATSIDDAWFLGVRDGAVDGEAVGTIVHWDGTVMHEVYAMKHGKFVSLWANAPDDVWASSDSLAPDAEPSVHWNGKEWLPFAKGFVGWRLWGGARNDLWALDNDLWNPLAEGAIRHWNGTEFETVLTIGRPLMSMAGAGPNEVWFGGWGGATLRYGPPSGSTLR